MSETLRAAMEREAKRYAETVGNVGSQFTRDVEGYFTRGAEWGIGEAIVHARTEAAVKRGRFASAQEENKAWLIEAKALEDFARSLEGALKP